MTYLYQCFITPIYVFISSLRYGQIFGQVPKKPMKEYQVPSSDEETPKKLMPMKKRFRQQEEKTMWIQIEDKCYKARYTE